MRRVGRREQHPVDVELVDQTGQVIGARRRHPRRAGRRRRSRQLESVLGVARELALERRPTSPAPTISVRRGSSRRGSTQVRTTPRSVGTSDDGDSRGRDTASSGEYTDQSAALRSPGRRAGSTSEPASSALNSVATSSKRVRCDRARLALVEAVGREEREPAQRGDHGEDGDDQPARCDDGRRADLTRRAGTSPASEKPIASRSAATSRRTRPRGSRRPARRVRGRAQRAVAQRPQRRGAAHVRRLVRGQLRTPASHAASTRSCM